MTELKAIEYFNIATCLAELGQTKASIEFLYKYEVFEQNKELAYGNIGEFFGFKLKMPLEAIKYLEKYIQINSKNGLAYNTLGHFYSVQYNDEHLDKQLEYFLNAHNIQPNNTTYIRNVIFIYERLFDSKNTEKYYQKLLKLNPTDLDLNNYGCFLINQGNLKDGYKYLEHRFLAPEVILEYPKWLDINKRLKSKFEISDKTILLFHEGGYGDSIMYCRFIEELQKHAKKIILCIPDRLIPLFKSSGIDVEMHNMNTDLSQYEYDFNASLVDLPGILEASIEKMPHPEGYLTVSEEKINDFKKQYLSNNGKLKIGISYCANPQFKNATQRDVPLKVFYPLTKLNNVEIYSLQVADAAEQIKHIPNDVKIIDLSKNFKTFEDSAAAILGLDLIISIDNVILNLSGALGAKTIALYNRFPEFRWYTTNGENVGWYNSVKPYCAERFNGWESLMDRVIKDLKKTYPKLN